MRFGNTARSDEPFHVAVIGANVRFSDVMQDLADEHRLQREEAEMATLGAVAHHREQDVVRIER